MYIYQAYPSSDTAITLGIHSFYNAQTTIGLNVWIAYYNNK